MFDWKVFEKHKNILSMTRSYRDLNGQHHLTSRPKDLLRWIEFCKDDLGYLILVDLVATKHPGHTELVYLLFNMDTHLRLNLHVHIGPGEITPSVVGHYTHADWLEREQAEKFDIRFNRPMASLLKGSEPFNLPKLRANPNKSEAPYPEEAFTWKNFGLLDERTEGKFQWQLCFDPVKVVDSRVRIGHHHKGLEDLFEKKNWQHIIQLADLINGSSGPSYAAAWAKTLEEVLRLKLTERAQAIRIVMLELARVADHLTVLHDIARSLKKNEYRLFLNAREKIFELFEKYSGHRLGRGSIKLGGVKEDLPHGWVVEFQEISNIIRKNIRIAHRSLLGQRDFRASLDHTRISAQAVLQWGVSGPAMRAAGLNFDLRRSQPLYFYQDIDFDVPVGIHGTSYDRYLIRFEEIHQSLRIIIQVLDNLPLGEIMNAQVTDPDFIDQQLQSVGERWHYSSLESPNGEAGFFYYHSDSVKPRRLKIKSPSFGLAQALPALVKGLEEWQLPGALASLGMNSSEQDR